MDSFCSFANILRATRDDGYLGVNNDFENHAATTLLTDLPPTRRQTRAAIAVVLIVLIAFAVVAPFSGRQAATLNAFFPHSMLLF